MRGLNRTISIFTICLLLFQNVIHTNASTNDGYVQSTYLNSGYEDEEAEPQAEIGTIFYYKHNEYKIISLPTDTSYGTCQVIGCDSYLFNIPPAVYYQKERYNCNSINSKTFRNNRKITLVQIESTAESYFPEIPANCFKGCKNIKRLNLYDTHLRKIGKNAFSGCTKIKFACIYSGVLKSVGKGAFNGVKNVTFFVSGHRLKKFKKLLSGKGAKKMRVYGS